MPVLAWACIARRPLCTRKIITLSAPCSTRGAVLPFPFSHFGNLQEPLRTWACLRFTAVGTHGGGGGGGADWGCEGRGADAGACDGAVTSTGDSGEAGASSSRPFAMDMASKIADAHSVCSTSLSA